MRPSRVGVIVIVMLAAALSACGSSSKAVPKPTSTTRSANASTTTIPPSAVEGRTKWVDVTARWKALAPKPFKKDPEAVAREIQGRVHAETGLTCAVGIGETRLQAKTATGFAKPGGIARLTRATWLSTMGDMPVTALWGIGERTAARLAEVGIRTVTELAHTDHNDLAARFGPTIGPNLRLLALGGHSAPIEGQPHVPRSRSREMTYERDLTDRSEIEDQVAALATEVTDSVVAEGRRVTHVAVKVRTSTFFTRSRIRKLHEPTIDPAVVSTTARGMLDLFDLQRPIRLLGVRVVLM